MVSFSTDFMADILVKNFVDKIYNTDAESLKSKINYIDVKDSDNYRNYSDTGDCNPIYNFSVERELEKIKIELVENVDSIALLSLLSNYEIGNTYGFIVINNKTKKMYNPMNIYAIDDFLEDYLKDYNEVNYNLVRFTYPGDEVKNFSSQVLETNFSKLFNLYSAISNNKKFIEVGVSNKLKSSNCASEAYAKVAQDYNYYISNSRPLFRPADLFNDYHNTTRYLSDKKYLVDTKKILDENFNKNLEYYKNTELIIPVSLATRYITYPYYGLIAITGGPNDMIGRNLSHNFYSGNINTYSEDSLVNRYYLIFDGDSYDIDEYEYDNISAIEIAENMGLDTDCLYAHTYSFDGYSIDESTYLALEALSYEGKHGEVLKECDYETYLDIYDRELEVDGIDSNFITQDSTYGEIIDALQHDVELIDNHECICYTYTDEESTDDTAIEHNGFLYAEKVCLGDNRNDITSLPVLKNMNISSMYYQETLGEWYREEAYNHQTIAQAIIKKFILDNKL